MGNYLLFEQPGPEWGYTSSVKVINPLVQKIMAQAHKLPNETQVKLAQKAVGSEKDK